VAASRAQNRKRSTGALVFFLKLWLVCTIALGVIALAALAGVPGVDKLGLPVFNRHAVWVWIALLAVSWAIRGIMIQFPGDVAAYVSTHTLDRFQEIRTKIKDAVTKWRGLSTRSTNTRELSGSATLWARWWCTTR
jgi:hypothetical protein